MNGDFSITHRMDSELTKLAYKGFSPTAVELTRLCLEYDKTPEEIIKMFKKINKELLN